LSEVDHDIRPRAFCFHLYLIARADALIEEREKVVGKAIAVLECVHVNATFRKTFENKPALRIGGGSNLPQHILLWESVDGSVAHCLSGGVYDDALKGSGELLGDPCPGRQY